MPSREIVDRVKQLQAGLRRVQPPPDQAPAVADLQRELDSVMLEPEHAPHYRTLAAKLRAAYDGLLAQHPDIAITVEQLFDELAEIGN